MATLKSLIAALDSQDVEDGNDTVQKVIDLLEQHDGEKHELSDILRKTLLEIAEEKERNQERRHKEIMVMLEQLVTQLKDNIPPDCNITEDSLEGHAFTKQAQAIQEICDVLVSLKMLRFAIDEGNKVRETVYDLKREEEDEQVEQNKVRDTVYDLKRQEEDEQEEQEEQNRTDCDEKRED